MSATMLQKYHNHATLLTFKRFNLCLGVVLLSALQVTLLWSETAEEIAEERAKLDATAFAEEEEAGRHGDVITQLWDALREDSDYPAVMDRFLPESVVLPMTLTYPETWEGPFGTISASGTQSNKATTLAKPQALALFKELKSKGWELLESEWHHLAFEQAEGPEKPASSTLNITLHFEKKEPSLERIIFRGLIKITWKDGAIPTMATADASKLQSWRRSGTLPFPIKKELHASDISALSPGNLHPIIVEDLNADGLPDICLGGANIFLLNKGDLGFTPGKLMSYADPISTGSVLADLDGDGHADLLSTDALSGTLQLFTGVADPKPEGPYFNEGKSCFTPKLPGTQAITCGDVDGDGDLDLFLGQYKPPFQGGTMPDPFYDANDGYPSYLLLNDGKGRFTDATVGSGLEEKRHRRNYAASFVDLDQDGHLDLVLTSDFAGVDVFQGDGKGHFEDRSESWIDQPRLFGMTQVLKDVNRDGFTDLFAIGMASTTARRLDHMNLGLEEEKKITSQRGSMGHGNRIYLASSGDSYALAEPDFGHDLAESGWSWGAAATDLDNNGLPDFYIANGHVSGKSASDYCSTFWRHDIYTPSRKKAGQAWKGYFAKQLAPLVNHETSWNGYEHNVAFIQQAPGKFTNLSFLLGLSNEGDSRVVVSADLDRDGDMDLITTILEPKKEITHRLVIYENTIPAGEAKTGWIGIDLGGPTASPWNARVTLTRADGSRESAVVTTGGSFASQKPSTVHFGLGSEKAVRSVEIRWPDGKTKTIQAPSINQWHRILPSD
ncbi:MAG: CRTAC1 family protein [Akkermansiaceae bacterium]